MQNKQEKENIAKYFENTLTLRQVFILPAPNFFMFDLTLFQINEKPTGYSQNFFSVKSLPKNFFASSSDLLKARTLVKRVKYFHYQIYEPQQGLIKLMKEHNCTLVVALSDFFAISYSEMAKRLKRVRVLVKIANNAKVRVRVFSLARNYNEIRDEYEIYWISKLLGMKDSQIENFRLEEYEQAIKN